MNQYIFMLVFHTQQEYGASCLQQYAKKNGSKITKFRFSPSMEMYGYVYVTGELAGAVG